MTIDEAYEFGKRETTQKYISELTDFNRQLIAQYDIPKTFLDDRALLQTVDLSIESDSLPQLTLVYVLKQPQQRDFKKARVGKNQAVFTVESVYDRLYKHHFKHLAQNHMADDRSRRLATIYAVKNTWKVYNEKVR